MPTSQKRIQVLLRPRVLEIVEGMAEDERMPASKILVQLIEEALINRGIDITSNKWKMPNVEGREHQTVSRNLKTDTDTELTEEDLKLIKIVKMIKEANL